MTDPEFLASEFFDAGDAVQVKSEMVHKVKVGAREEGGGPALR